MAIVQCAYGHYYDDRRTDHCPYCEKAANDEIADDMNEQYTSYIDPMDEDDIQLTEGYGEYVTEGERTIGIFDFEDHNVLTVGWLVCVKGAEKGKSYSIHNGRNFIGRALHMDIVFDVTDNDIQEEKHASLVYDPKSRDFYVVADGGHTYVNGEAVASQVLLNENDVIAVGQGEYVFVPFCKEGREWN